MSRAVLLSVVLSLGFAPVPFLKRPDRPEAALKVLQGEWFQVDYLQGGKRIFEEGKPSQVIVGDRLSVRRFGEEVSRWRIVLDASRPSEVMLLVGEAPADLVGQVLRQRYRLVGNRLTISSSRPGAPAPDGLEPRKGLAVRAYRMKKP